MKTSAHFFKCCLILSLAFLLAKPAFFYINNQNSSTTQYTHTTECPVRAAISGLCQASAYYTAVEENLTCLPYLFMTIGLVLFVLPNLFSTAPKALPFRPPI
ncbi:hypothetical protein ACNVED_03490 [Legionella sp. D16C41]|uniref:hypothetical protein n=1 Tax=Legionella sp. D16C41 TaxID=3402688 RepID=UPI003AF5B233